MGHMNSSQQKVVQYLSEARASENALVRTLQSQIAMTPRGSYRSALGKHLDETQGHAQQVADRLDALDGGANPIAAVVGFWEDVIGQALALSKTPLDLLRGSGGEEKVLKNAKDACATEALEIATYTAIERLARAVGDDDTADLAQRILADEERMLQRIMREIPTLTDAVAPRRGQGAALLRHRHHRSGRGGHARRGGDHPRRGQDHGRCQAHRSAGPQGPGRGPRRRSGQGGRRRSR